MRILLSILIVLAAVFLIESAFNPPAGFWLVALLLVLALIVARGGIMFLTGKFDLRRLAFSGR